MRSKVSCVTCKTWISVWGDKFIYGEWNSNVYIVPHHCGVYALKVAMKVNASLCLISFPNFNSEFDIKVEMSLDTQNCLCILDSWIFISTVIKASTVYNVSTDGISSSAAHTYIRTITLFNCMSSLITFFGFLILVYKSRSLTGNGSRIKLGSFPW